MGLKVGARFALFGAIIAVTVGARELAGIASGVDAFDGFARLLTRNQRRGRLVDALARGHSSVRVDRRLNPTRGFG